MQGSTNRCTCVRTYAIKDKRTQKNSDQYDAVNKNLFKLYAARNDTTAKSNEMSLKTIY